MDGLKKNDVMPPGFNENGMLVYNRKFYPPEKMARRAIIQMARRKTEFTVLDICEDLERRFMTARGSILPILRKELAKMLQDRGIELKGSEIGVHLELIAKKGEIVEVVRNGIVNHSTLKGGRV